MKEEEEEDDVGLFADLKVRVIEQTIDKSDLLHWLRMTLAYHMDEEITQCFYVKLYRFLLFLSLAFFLFYFSSFLFHGSFLNHFSFLNFLVLIGCLIG